MAATGDSDMGPRCFGDGRHSLEELAKIKCTCAQFSRIKTKEIGRNKVKGKDIKN